MRNLGSRGSAPGARPANAISEREATTRAVTGVIRRLGRVLMAAHEVSEKKLIELDMPATAAELRDAIKPLYDAMIHFEFDSTETTDEA